MNRDATVCRSPFATRIYVLLKSSFDGRKRHPRVSAALAGVGVTAFVFVIYLRTLAPTILPYDRPDLLDVPMLQMQVCVLGMTHPTGYPSYLMMSHLFTYLPFGDCAYRANLASATYAALAVLAVFAAGCLLSRWVVAAAAAALAFGPAELPGRLAFYWDHLLDNLHWGLLVAAMVGFAAMLLWDRPAAGLLGFLYVGWVFYSVENDIPDIEVYFIPTYLVLALAMTVGFGLLLTEAEDLLTRFPKAPKRVVLGVLLVALVLLPLPGVGDAYARNDRSGDYQGHEIIEDVAENAAPNSTILHHRSNLWYMVLVEKRRQDLNLVDPFWHNRNVAYTDIVWPADLNLETTNRIYGTNDFTGVTAAKKAAKKGPVYVINQEDVNLSGLHEAGFRMVHVHGILYELIAPGKEPSANEGYSSPQPEKRPSTPHFDLSTGGQAYTTLVLGRTSRRGLF